MGGPQGWYDDGQGEMRRLDGSQWSDRATDEHGESGGPDSAVSALAAIRPPADVALAERRGEESQSPEATTAGEPTKSKLWIVWVILSVIVLGVVTAAVVVIPQLVSILSAQNSSRLSAVAAVKLYDEAWRNADCAAYLQSTTPHFRTESGLEDCSAFETKAEQFNSTVRDYKVAVTGVHPRTDHLEVATRETYTSLVDESGMQLDQPLHDSLDWRYVIVRDGDHWMINDQR